MLRSLPTTSARMLARTLTRTLAAGALAMSLAAAGISATVTPAAAHGHRNNGAEAAAVLGGLLLLYGLSQAGRNGSITRHHPAPIPVQPVPQPNFRVAPAQCFIEGRDNNGYYRGYLARCTEQSVRNPNLLPAQCLRNVWTVNGQRRIYGGQCLAQNGWVRG